MAGRLNPGACEGEGETKGKQVLPPACFLISILAMAALRLVYPAWRLIPSPYNYSGVLLMLAGFAANIWPSNSFNKAKTTIKPYERSTCLVTNGLFRFTRNPMYLGMVATLVGLAVLLGTVTPAVVIPVFVWISGRFIKVEEKALEETFGETYLQYKRRVRRWL